MLKLLLRIGLGCILCASGAHAVGQDDGGGQDVGGATSGEGAQNETSYSDSNSYQFQIPVQKPEGEKATEIVVTLRINKLYDIEPIHQTFKVDSYIAMEWEDPRVVELVPADLNSVVFEDQQVDEWENVIWNPAIEIINNVGIKEISNKRLIIDNKGMVVYNERFNAVLESRMNFKRFPFDRHTLAIKLEAFSYDAKSLIFMGRKSSVYPVSSDDWPLIEWEVVDRRLQTFGNDYSYLSSTEEDIFHQFSFEVDIVRNPGYFVWKVFFPLSIIMVSTWSVFFVRDFATQLTLVSTLMLTVYAFNFFISGLLPELPYNTFIEMILISSFLTIFLQFGYLVWCHHQNVVQGFRRSVIDLVVFVSFFSCCAGLSWTVCTT